MKRALLFLGLLLTACGAQAAPMEVLHIGLSPNAQPISAALLTCMPQEGVEVHIDPFYPSQADLTELDVYFQLGVPNERPAFAAQIAEERAVFVVNSAQNLRSLTALNVAALLSGRITNWQELGGGEGDVLLFVPPDGDEARQAFSAGLRAAIGGQALIATGPQTLLENVAANSGAAGILPAAWAAQEPALQAFDFDVSLPVLALAAQTPQGPARTLLACLQGPSGQAILAESYAP